MKPKTHLAPKGPLEVEVGLSQATKKHYLRMQANLKIKKYSQSSSAQFDIKIKMQLWL